MSIKSRQQGCLPRFSICVIFVWYPLFKEHIRKGDCFVDSSGIQQNARAGVSEHQGLLIEGPRVLATRTPWLVSSPSMRRNNAIRWPYDVTFRWKTNQNVCSFKEACRTGPTHMDKMPIIVSQLQRGG